MAIYVERGAADLGVAGRDILLEYPPDVYELLDLGIGKCRMCVAGPPKVSGTIRRRFCGSPQNSRTSPKPITPPRPTDRHHSVKRFDRIGADFAFVGCDCGYRRDGQDLIGE
ncbi:MAG: hypothetical protein V8S89_05385 [Oscillospiraceae bacterium]